MASTGSDAIVDDKKKEKSGLQKSYFDVLGLCCSSEVPLIEKIVRPLEGVVEVNVIVPSRTVIVLHDPLLITDLQIVKALNQAQLEANIRVKGKTNYRGRWPSPFVIASGILLALSFLKYVYHPLQWLAVGAVVVGIWPIITRGVVAIRNFSLDVNILMLIAVVGTIAMKDYTEAGTIVFLFTIAEWLESRASHKATAVMSSLLSMAPQTATIAETGEVVNVEDVKLNTILAVKAGEMIPVDGVVVDGTCEVDEKTLTGESFPVPKQNDSIVWAGTVNVNGYISVKTTALAEDCAVAKMARLVEEAQNNRSSVQRLVDKCAKYYTPAVVLISAGLAVVPVILKLHHLTRWFRLALVVLVSACPCGLILSTPVATFCALSRAATAGLLIKGGDYLEILAKLKTIAFDKTGTITRGEFTVINIQTLAEDVSLKTLLYWVSSIESKSSHPIAAVLVDYARSRSIEPKPENVQEFQNYPGEGVSGNIDGRNLYIGNKKLSQRANFTLASNIAGDANEGKTSGFIFSGTVLIGTFSLSDNCRSGAADAIRALKSMGIKTALLTGDNQSAALHAQEQIGHALDIVHAELLPEDKVRIIQEYKQDGPTAMVGDGVNDAPALATADVGISMGVSGSALATETGHVILMSNDIRKIPTAIKLARRTRWKVIQNLIFSMATKVGVLAYAFAGHPLVWLAVLVDVATCLIVIFNSMLLLRGSGGHEKKCFGLFNCHSHKKGAKCNTSSQHCSKAQQCCTDNAASKECHSSQKCSSPCQTSKCKSSAYGLHQQLDAHPPHEGHCSTIESTKCASEFQSHPHNVSETCKREGDECCQPPCCGEDHCLDLLESQSCCADDMRLDEGTCCESSTGESIKHETSDCNHGHFEDLPNLSASKHQDEWQEQSDAASLGRNHGEATKAHSHHHKHTHNEAISHKMSYQGESATKHAHQHGLSHETSCHGESARSHTHPNVIKKDTSRSGENCVKHAHHHALSHGSSCHDSHSANHVHHSHSAKHVHHHAVSHGISCHEKSVHECTGLRKREMGACCKSYRKECCNSTQRTFFGGLTEIVTE